MLWSSGPRVLRLPSVRTGPGVTQAVIECSIHIFGFMVYIPASRPDISESGPGKADAECR